MRLDTARKRPAQNVSSVIQGSSELEVLTYWRLGGSKIESKQLSSLRLPKGIGIGDRHEQLYVTKAKRRLTWKILEGQRVGGDHLFSRFLVEDCRSTHRSKIS